MKFTPKKPREGINVSDTHPLTEAGLLIVGLSAIFAAVVLALVFFIDFALLYLSADTEKKIFSNWTPEDLVELASDDVRTAETQALLDRLVRHWPDTVYDFRLEISESDTANAMAIPGGLIVVTKGLLDRVQSENELAFVLGHELGHFQNRDHIRQLGRGTVLGLLIVAISGNEGGANFGMTIADLMLRGFSRKQESKADKFGLEIVYAEYGHVDESWRFFDRIDQNADIASDLVVYASTHPAAGDRVDDIKFHAEASGWPLAGNITPLNW